MTASKRVLIPIADGSEEIETICIQDTLVRFGASVTLASVDGDAATMSRGLKILADTSIAEACESGDDWDLIVLPGGVSGAERLRDSTALIGLLHRHATARKMYGAICAAPALVLESHGLIPHHAPATSYPKFLDRLRNPSAMPVVVADNLVTSQGPGTALEFALELGEQLFGKDRRDEIAKQLLVK